jgi:hypothetical protein
VSSLSRWVFARLNIAWSAGIGGSGVWLVNHASVALKPLIVVIGLADRRMRVAKKLALIGAGYVLSVGGGIAAVAVNELLIPDDIKRSSGGMVAFGDMIVFVLGAGVSSLAPTWFLLKLCVEKVPRSLLAAQLLIAATGPASWLAVRWMAANAGARGLPQAFSGLLGPLIAFGAIPRMVFGPVLLVVEAATFFLARERLTRMLLSAAMLMDLIPLSIYALHLTAAIHR